MDYTDSPVLRRFVREPPELPKGEQVTLADVKRLIERYQRPVKDAWPVSVACRFIRRVTMEEK